MIAYNPQEMQNIAKSLGKQGHHKFLFFWDLWTGKTEFTKWFAEFLGINQDIVQSPTYTYMNEYQETLLHIDMYRIEESEDIIEKWLIDKIEDYDYICIEWPKFTNMYQDEEFTRVDITKQDNYTRDIHIDN